MTLYLRYFFNRPTMYFPNLFHLKTHVLWLQSLNTLSRALDQLDRLEFEVKSSYFVAEVSDSVSALRCFTSSFTSFYSRKAASYVNSSSASLSCRFYWLPHTHLEYYPPVFSSLSWPATSPAHLSSRSELASIPYFRFWWSLHGPFISADRTVVLHLL